MIGAGVDHAARADTSTIGAPVAPRTDAGAVTSSAVAAVAAGTVGTNTRTVCAEAVGRTLSAGSKRIQTPVRIADTATGGAAAMAAARCAVKDGAAVFAERATAAQGTAAETTTGHPIRAGSVARTNGEVGVWGCYIVAAGEALEGEEASLALSAETGGAVGGESEVASATAITADTLAASAMTCADSASYSVPRTELLALRSIVTFLAVRTAEGLGPEAKSRVAEAPARPRAGEAVSACSMAEAYLACSSWALFTAVRAEVSGLAFGAHIALPEAELWVGVACAADGRRFAHTTAVALNAIDFGTLLVAGATEPIWGTSGAVRAAPVPSDVGVEAGTRRVRVAHALAITRFLLTAGTLLCAVCGCVAKEALAQPRARRTVAAQAVAVARRAVRCTRAADSAGASAVEVLTAARSCCRVASAVTRAWAGNSTGTGDGAGQPSVP